jgi:hypothetical protein
MKIFVKGAHALLVSICALVASSLLLTEAKADTSYFYTTYVGSWHVGDGPRWSAAVQPTYTAQSAAALLFGGSPSDYVISTNGSNVASINRLAWYDGYALGLGQFADTFSNGASYTNGVRSAYILDNSCSNRYSNPASACTDAYVNYAFSNTFICTTTPNADTCLISASVPQTIAIDGDGGTDALQLGGAANFSFNVAGIGATYTNFETFQKVGTSNATLAGTATTGVDWDIQAGTLTASGGSSETS